MKNQIKQWEKLGASDPYWAVLAHPDKKGNRWDKDEFFLTGEQEIKDVLNHISCLGIQVNKATALDFGCGVGRLTRALSPHFEKVIGLDISAPMLKEARTVNSKFPNLVFGITNGRTLDGTPDASINFIYSNIALQHSPVDAQISVIREFLRVLSPDGVAVFQTPSHERITLKGIAHRLLGNRLLNFVRRFLYGPDSVFEIHTFHQNKVEALISKEGGIILHRDRLDSTGPAYVGIRYVIRKQL